MESSHPASSTRLALAALLFALALAFAGCATTASDSTQQPDVPPRFKEPRAPQYPYNLRKARIPGNVVIEFFVNEEGLVTSAKIVSSTHPDFDAPALEAIRGSTFTPAMRDGKPIGVRMRVPIYFDPGPPPPASDAAPARGDSEEAAPALKPAATI